VSALKPEIGIQIGIGILGFGNSLVVPIWSGVSSLGGFLHFVDIVFFRRIDRYDP
jgi:hypothetical protein